jgi:catechol-2,3-dioxygenase
MANGTLDDFDASVDTVTSPSTLAHVVLRTANFQPMVDFYTNFLGGSITYGNAFIAFITYDEEHHRVAILNVPGTGPKQPTSSGLEHIAFTFPTLHALLLAYRQRKQKGIDPVWSVNHGPTTSIYYKDPDRNMLETQVDNFDTIEDANAFMNSPHFAHNPIGTDVDPEDIINRLRNGESESLLKKRVEVGARELQI